MIDETKDDRPSSQPSGVERGRPLRPGDPPKVGDYRLIRVLGEGGMGRVYLAQGATGQIVAIKMIRDEVANDADFRRRFRREVERAKQVPSFSTAEVLDADPDHDPPYLVVEFVDGPSLEEVVMRHGPFTASNLRSLAIGMAAALRAIHDAGVIHRDLKPSNVLLARGSLKVIDFGIARPVVNPTTLTDPERMVGTVAYMSPERFYLDERKNLTSAADIFAWGAVVTYAGTGQAPFIGDSTGVVVGRIVHGTPNLSGLTDPLRGLVELALAKNPTERPTAQQLIDRLTAADTPPLVRPGVSVPSAGRAEVPGTPAGRSGQPGVRPRRALTVSRSRSTTPFRWLAGAVALIALAVAAAAQGWLGDWPGGEPSDLPTTATPPRPQLLWTVPTGRAMSGQPVLWKDKLYFGGKDGVYAVNRHPPHVRWRYPTNGPVVDSPQITDHGMMYATTKQGYVYALRANRQEELWARRATDKPLSSSPRIAREQLYVGDRSGVLYAYNMSGTQLWKEPTDGAVTTTPVFVRSLVLVGTEFGDLYAFTPGSDQRWHKEIGGRISSLVAAHDKAYITSDDMRMYAFDVDTGDRHWSVPTSGMVGATPDIEDGTIYFGTSDGYLHAVDTRDGAERWRFPVGGEGSITASPIFVDGRVYVSSLAGRIFAVNAATGRKEWEYATEGGVAASLTVDDDALYAGATDGRIYALALPNTGTRTKSTPSQGPTTVRPPAKLPRPPRPPRPPGPGPNPTTSPPTTGVNPPPPDPSVTEPPPPAPPPAPLTADATP